MRAHSFQLVLAVALLAAAPGRVAANAAPDSVAVGAPDPALAPTTDVPWTPERPVRAAETWESVLRFPGKVVSFPLSLLGDGVEWSLAWAEDQSLFYRLGEFLVVTQRIGITAGSASLGDGAGFGGTVFWTPPLLARHVTAEISGTTNRYNRTRLAAHFGPVSALYANEWRPQDPLYGFGMDAPREDESNYAVHAEDVRLIVSFPTGAHDGEAMPLIEGLLMTPDRAAGTPSRFQASAWAGPAALRLSEGRAEGAPSFDEQFPVLADQLGRRVEHLVYGGRVAYDRRSGQPRWTRGWRGSFAAERFDRSIEALALRDAHSDARPFTRLTYLVEGGVSFWPDPRTLRASVKVVDQHVGDGGTFLVPSLSKLGASEGLDGFDAGRFHDTDLILGRLAYIFPLGKNLEFEWYTEAGGVFPELDAARIDALETSYGGLLRIRGDTSMLGMLGFAWSREGARFRFSIGGVE